MIIIAKIIKPHGIAGECLISAFTDDLNNFFNYKNFYFQNNGCFVNAEIENKRFIKNKSQILIKLKNCSDRNYSEKLRGRFLYINKRNLKQLSKDEYYNFDLIGCDCYHLNEDKEKSGRQYFGKVLDMLNFGTADLFHIEMENGKKINIPFLKNLTNNIDITEKQITFSYLEGYL